MNYYVQLAKTPVFSITDVQRLTNNVKTAYSVLGRLIKEGMVIKIRNNLYSCINPSTGQVIATRFQIACAITESAYISHHSAIEYHGLANQVYNVAYVSSRSKFNDFEYDAVTYKYINSKIDIGIEVDRNRIGVKVTDLERTVIDSIKDSEKISGMEEVINAIKAISYLDQNKLLLYLEAYGIQVLYQKVGYILRYMKDDLQLTESFFNVCLSKAGKSTRYLLNVRDIDSFYDKEWRLVVPNSFIDMIKEGGDEIV